MANDTKTIVIEVKTDKSVKNVDKLTNAVEKTTEQNKRYKKSVTESSEASKRFSNWMDKMTGGLFSSVKGIGTMVKSLKVLKVALISTFPKEIRLQVVADSLMILNNLQDAIVLVMVVYHLAPIVL